MFNNEMQPLEVAAQALHKRLALTDTIAVNNTEKCSKGTWIELHGDQSL